MNHIFRMNQNNSLVFSSILCIMFGFLFFVSCNNKSDQPKETSFDATVVSVSEDTLVVRPEDDTREDDMATQIYVPIDTQIFDRNEQQVDQTKLLNAARVNVTYDGVLEDSDPAQIKNCYRITILE